MSALTSSAVNLTPRLSTSTKWTPLPGDFSAKVVTIFEKQFPKESVTGDFLIDGRIYPGEIILRAGYVEKGRLKQINFEASVDIPKAAPGKDEVESQTMNLLYLCIDALGSLMEEYFQVGDVDQMEVPVRWQEFEFEGEPVFMQYSHVNTRLEEEADRLLAEAEGLAAKELVNEAKMTEDALGLAEIDSELAFEIQKMIREGKFPGQAPSGDNELN